MQRLLGIFLGFLLVTPALAARVNVQSFSFATPPAPWVMREHYAEAPDFIAFDAMPTAQSSIIGSWGIETVRHPAANAQAAREAWKQDFLARESKPLPGSHVSGNVEVTSQSADEVNIGGLICARVRLVLQASHITQNEGKIFLSIKNGLGCPHPDDAGLLLQVKQTQTMNGAGFDGRASHTPLDDDFATFVNSLQFVPLKH